jgi:hypothetical protein
MEKEKNTRCRSYTANHGENSFLGDMASRYGDRPNIPAKWKEYGHRGKYSSGMGTHSLSIASITSDKKEV